MKRSLRLFIITIIIPLTFLSSYSDAFAYDSDEFGRDSAFGRLAFNILGETNNLMIAVWDADTDWDNGRKEIVDIDVCPEADYINPALSKDGSMLAFATNCDFKGLNPNNHYWIAVSRLGSDDLNEYYPMTIGTKTLGYDSLNPTFNSAGNKIAFESNLSGESRIYTMDVWNQIDEVNRDINGYKITKRKEMSDEYAIDPYWGNGAEIVVQTESGVGFMWADGSGYLNDFNNKSGTPSEIFSGKFTPYFANPVVVKSSFSKPQETIKNWNIGNISERGCDPRSELFAFSTGGFNPPDAKRYTTSNTAKIVLNCFHPLDKKSPSNLKTENTFATFEAIDNLNNGFEAMFPEPSPDGKSLAYVQPNGQVMIKKWENESYWTTHFAGNNNIRIPINYIEKGSPISWSYYDASQPLADLGGETINIGVGNISLGVDVGGGVNEIFGAQQDSLEQQFDKQVQLDLNRIESYIAELEFNVESELKFLEFDKNSWIAQEEKRLYDMETQMLGDSKRNYDYVIEDLKRSQMIILENFDADTKRELINFENEYQSFEEEKPLKLAAFEAGYAYELEDRQFEKQRRETESENSLNDRLSYLSSFWAGEDQKVENYYDSLIDSDRENNGGVNVGTYAQYKADALNNHAMTQENDRNNAYDEHYYRLEQIERDTNYEFDEFYQRQERELLDFKRELDLQQNDILIGMEDYKAYRNTDREYTLSDQQYQMETTVNQQNMYLEETKFQVKREKDNFALDLERNQMQWDLREQQIMSNYEIQLQDYNNQKEQLLFQAELDKQMLVMDQAQMEMEMMQMQDDISSRQFEAEAEYEFQKRELQQENEEYMNSIEERRADEGWDDEQYQEELREYDKWLLDKQFEIDQRHEQGLRDIEFEKRQYNNLQTVVNSNELYQDGERGFFGNPLPGSIRQGGFEENLEDPGFLAMIGIVLTVGTTLIQLSRGK